MRGARILLRAGATVFSIGLLLVAFVSYQLWGTALYEHHAQHRLVSELHSLIGLERLPSATPAARAAKPPAADRPTTTRPTPPSSSTRPTTAAPATSTAAAPTTTTTLPVLTSGSALPTHRALVSETPSYLGYVAPAAAAPATGTPIGYLSIPKIGLDDAIVQGVDEVQLQQGPGHYPGTPLPGEAGNASIAGHRTTYAAPFYHLDALAPGDAIYVQTAQGTFQYDVTQSFAVLPSNISVLDATAAPTLTLTTCNPRYSATQRLVVKAELVASAPPASSASTTTTTGASPVPSNAARSATLAGESAGTSSPGAAGAVLWGLGTAGAAGAVLFLRRRLRTPIQRRFAVGLGVPLVAAALLAFFGQVSAVLPSSF